MSKGVNKVILIGNCGQDPEVRYMPNGEATVSRSRKKRNTTNNRNKLANNPTKEIPTMGVNHAQINFSGASQSH